MTPGTQKEKAVAELVSGDFEVSGDENIQSEIHVACSNKSPKMQPEKLDEIKTSLRKEIMSDITKILAEAQEEMLRLIAPTTNKATILVNLENSDSETKYVQPTSTSEPITSNVTTSRNSPITSRNSWNDFL